MTSLFLRPMGQSRPLGMALLATLATACGPDPVTFEILSPPPAEYSLNGAELTITEGTAIVVAVRDSDREPLDSDARLVIVSRDGEIAKVAPSLEPDEFVFYGVSPGHTAMRVFLDNELTNALDVTVVAQRP